MRRRLSLLLACLIAPMAVFAPLSQGTRADEHLVM